MSMLLLLLLHHAVCFASVVRFVFVAVPVDAVTGIKQCASVPVYRYRYIGNGTNTVVNERACKIQENNGTYVFS